MTQKTYRSGCALVLVIATPTNNNLKIRFEPGGNFFFYRTTDEDIQNGLEKCRDYGISYELCETIDLDAVQKQTSAEPEEDKAENTLTEVPVSSLADAKEYLAEQFGYARSNLRSKAAITKAAEEHGVVFVGI